MLAWCRSQRSPTASSCHAPNAPHRRPRSPVPPSSKARQVGIGYAPALHVHVAVLNAGRKRRKHLPRVQETVWIERAFETLLLREIFLTEHHWHQVAFFHTDAMFAGQHTAHFDAEPQNVRAKRF